jgi:hypothetical protein
MLDSEEMNKFFDEKCEQLGIPRDEVLTVRSHSVIEIYPIVKSVYKVLKAELKRDLAPGRR